MKPSKIVRSTDGLRGLAIVRSEAQAQAVALVLATQRAHWSCLVRESTVSADGDAGGWVWSFHFSAHAEPLVRTTLGLVPQETGLWRVSYDSSDGDDLGNGQATWPHELITPDGTVAASFAETETPEALAERIADGLNMIESYHRIGQPLAHVRLDGPRSIFDRTGGP